MKKIVGIILFLVMVLPSLFAQSSNVGDGKWSVGGGIQIIDLFSPQPGYKYGFKNPLFFGPRAFVWKNFNASFSINLDISTIIKKKELDPSLPFVNVYKFNALFGAIYKFNNGYIFKTTSPVAPYFFADIQGSWIGINPEGNNKFGFGIPLGAGINWRLTDDLALQTQAGYTFGLTKGFENQIFYSTGIIADFKNRKKEIIPIKEEIIPESDFDNDGIFDNLDACPQVYGVSEFNGCPDTDGDGVKDSDDFCPNEFGLLIFNGCPDSDEDGIPNTKDLCPFEKGISILGGCPERKVDTDGDGVFNSEDKCPSVFGTKENDGCPEIDTDMDGVIDKNDKCPAEVGPASNSGCPVNKSEIDIVNEMRINNLNFETGRADLNLSAKQTLNNLVDILNKRSSLVVEISGHTDNIGNEVFNKNLSLQRAKVAAEYLVTNGIDSKRITIKGFGSEQPIDSNATEAGRTKNRRTEIKIIIP